MDTLMAGEVAGHYPETMRRIVNDLRPPVAPTASNVRREIHILPQLQGFIVKVGCQTVVFETVEKMAREITRYYNDPHDVEEQYLGRGKYCKSK